MTSTATSTGSLQSVDSLKITFLVDNAVEWFNKLPPGFTHEIRNHLSQNPPVDEVTGVPFVDLENYCCGAHGFSALIETQVEGSPSYFTLFDSGPDSKSLVRNIDSLQVHPTDISRIVLSHWHADHSGGILSFLKMRAASIVNAEGALTPGPCVLDLHPKRPDARGIAGGPLFDKVFCRLPNDPTFEEIEDLGGVVEKSSEGHAVAGGTVWVSGEIPRVTSFEVGLPGSFRWIDGKWQPENHIMDERWVAIDVFGKGLVIFTACSHAGVVNVVKDAVARFSRPVHMIIGGLHLGSDELAYRIPLTVDFLARQLRPTPTYVLPMHCSGFSCKVALREALGEGSVPAGVGIKVQVTGDRAGEKHMMAPVITL